MANSKLLKDAIADAKAVRETAIANAKIALEEAFTPRLQSILSKKITTEMEADDEEVDMNEEYGADDVDATDSSEIGAGEGQDGSGTDGDAPQGIATDAHTELGDTEKETSEPGKEDENMPLAEGEEEDEMHEEEESEMQDEDELDLESIIRELEDELGMEESEELGYEDPTNADDAAISEEDDEMEAPVAAEEPAEAEVTEEDEIDLEEILREMGYGDDEEEKVEEGEEESDKAAEMEAELEEAYKVIKSLKSTINEVNLLNAKLLYTNKLFRSYDLTNEQKHKVVETLDRTQNVREVKLVFATLAESMKIGGTAKKVKTNKITESFASKKVASTAPKTIIAESNSMAERFKKLANIK
jgi:hypothetical protein